MKSKPRLTYVISNIDRWAQFEWIADELIRRQYPTQFILMNSKPGYFSNYLQEENYEHANILYKNKKDLPRAILQLRELIKKWRTDIVHCHFLDASLAGLAAARLVGVKTRIHTRHHANFHHVYSPKGIWLDKFNNSLSTEIVAISRTVKELLVDKEHVPAGKVHVVNHGFRLNEFTSINKNKVDEFKVKYNLNLSVPVIGVASRFILWKGVQHIIDGFKLVLESQPNAILVLANARGPDQAFIQKKLSSLPKKNYRLIEFENDMASLFHCFDIFVHCPIDSVVEGFGQVYIEAAAASRACVFTRSGIANDYFTDNKDCLIVAHESAQEIFSAISKLIDDEGLRKNLGQSAQALALSEFSIEKMVDQFERIYLA